MSVNSLFILLCASILVGFVVGKNKINGASSTLLDDRGNIDELIERKEVRRPVRQYSQYNYDEYAAQNGYGSQGSQGANGYNPVGQQDGYDGYGQKNKNNGFISGRVRPGEVVSIGNGVGHTSVVAINSGNDADTYVGYTDGKVSHGYDQSVYPNRKGQADINKKPDDDVLLWSNKGNKQSGIKVDNDGVQLYSEHGTYPNRKVQSGIEVKAKPGGQEDVLLRSSKGNKHSQIRVNNGKVQIDTVNGYGDASQTSYNQQTYDEPTISQPIYSNGAIINVPSSASVYVNGKRIFPNQQDYY